MEKTRFNYKKKAFLALKFHDGGVDRQKVAALSAALKSAGIDTFVVVRDVEHYGETPLSKSAKLMPDYAFPAMKTCDLFVVDFSEKGVGLGIGTGYAYAIGLPVFVIAKTGSDISTTIHSLATEIIFYDDPAELTDTFRRVVGALNHDH